ncbi:hypothetical protein JQ554_14015 [Bradyrhizobium diazoefficiens]|nr:hypothetical protein [Bradyrhizobium diazoefficiens]MBR0965043.1 hypothetical protein [Bradyrhizobium diazoefficiens]MBR0976404.1 hypothetical protein [Bradyrhizobium diazoefficiens]MBR1008494.1 hypothetical protein [Bradyrhizobium diazoefficiens]MBR1015003.1 hypothetical protein [Bradyrhizobium diazoefficiens]MBR1052210.1 hypothetical protein [Bradyrhizobium diazoefficiens]
MLEIVSSLKQYAEVSISTADYEFKSLDELKEHVGAQATLFVLDIDTAKPFVSIDLTRMEARLYISAGPQAAQLLLELDGILSRCQRPFPWAYRFWFVMLLSALSFGLNIFFLNGRPELVAQIASLALSGLSLWPFWVGYVNVRRVCVIKMQRRSERRSFFERNQDQLIMLLVGALVGGLVTFAGVMVKEHFYPSTPAVNAPKSP